MKLPSLLVTLTVTALFSSSAYAAAGSDYEVTYFKERAMTTEIGRFYKPCGTGSAKLTGKRTPYFVKSQSKCASGGSLGGASLSCHFFEAGCTDALVAQLLPIRTPSRRTAVRAVSERRVVKKSMH